MSSKGVVNSEFIETNMDEILYSKIISENLLEPATKRKLVDSYIFQQEHDPKHKSKIIEGYFA